MAGNWTPGPSDIVSSAELMGPHWDCSLMGQGTEHRLQWLAGWPPFASVDGAVRGASPEGTACGVGCQGRGRKSLCYRQPEGTFLWESWSSQAADALLQASGHGLSVREILKHEEMGQARRVFPTACIFWGKQSTGRFKSSSQSPCEERLGPRHGWAP